MNIVSVADAFGDSWMQKVLKNIYLDINHGFSPQI
jgi:hypothetical protein